MAGENSFGPWACFLDVVALLPLAVGFLGWWGPWVAGPLALGMVLALAAFIVGIRGFRYRKKHPNAGGAGCAIAGVVLGALVLLLYLVLALGEVAERLAPHMH
jgi:hypothetical protein